MGQPLPENGSRDSAGLAHAHEALEKLTHIEAQFGQVKEGLTHLQRLSTVGTLTATVVHELNNILTPVMSYAQMALSRPDDQALAAKAHTKALEGARRGSQLCASLLGYARDDHSSCNSNLQNVVHAAVDCLGNGLGAQGIELKLDVPEIDLAIPPTDLEQVLVNLLLNARKAMQPSGGLLAISVVIDRSSAQIDVADSGGGIPEAIADRVFEPFVTLDPAPDRGQQTGTGLGLSVCRDLIEQAEGKIAFSSMPGQGTTFHIRIPLAQPMRRSA